MTIMYDEADNSGTAPPLDMIHFHQSHAKPLSVLNVLSLVSSLKLVLFLISMSVDTSCMHTLPTLHIHPHALPTSRQQTRPSE
ncbi:hypothetical protein K457DRAFT_608217 [Linnemannia elongata AG-77]|uniref:Uncharacterized protein n=1 Tax=Linnemannia elongata AG-77 TaxID=1314771 RepID=A0A197JU12_9FUNG|nr:hypothetical protein K457DRAFT_608217 [Linnemannia elongata AG-77]